MKDVSVEPQKARTTTGEVGATSDESPKPNSAIDRDVVGQVVLALQGGGALGAYQAGVYQALHEAVSNRTGSSARRSVPSTPA